MRRLAATLVALACSALAAAACTPASTLPKRTMVAGHYFVEPGAPDPLSCREDKECTGDTVTRDDGCCVLDPTPWPQTWVWRTWLSNRRSAGDCRLVSCPEPPKPSEPDPCGFDVHCVAGRCKSACAWQ
jgi:hypothetical protein